MGNIKYKAWCNMIDDKISELQLDEFKKIINNPSSKLRTYKRIKNEMKLEDYAVRLCRYDRCLIAELRSGVLPLRIETDRWAGMKQPQELRTCEVCESKEVEDEKHFLLYCEYYMSERKELVEALEGEGVYLYELDETEQLKILYDEAGRHRAIVSFIRRALKKRKRRLACLLES